MEIIGFLLGLLIFFLIRGLIKKADKYQTSRRYEKANDWRMSQCCLLDHKWAEFFDDEDYMRGIPRGLKFKYYGGTWQLGGASELYWVCQSFNGMEKEEPVYKSSWNYFRNDFDSMKYIMENHPNLQDARKRLKTEDKTPEIIRSFKASFDKKSMCS